MIRHIVMWKFKENTKKEMQEFLDGLMGLKGQIEVIRHMETGVSVNSDNSYDAVLVCDFDSTEDLKSYQNDPRHLKVAGLCKEIRISRADVDYEIEG